MTLFDVILFVLLGGFVMFGAWFGFFHTLGSLVGTVVGTFVGGWLHIPLGNWLMGIFGESQWVYIITFAVVFMVTSRLVGFGFHLLDTSFQIVTRLPFLSSVDKILGAVVGFFEGVLVIGLLLYVASRYELGAWMTHAFATSTVAPWFVSSSALLQPLFPQTLKEIRSIIGI